MKANKKTPKKNLDRQYYKEPIEIDAFMTEIAHTIKTQFQQIKDDIKDAEHDITISKLPETKKMMQRKLEKLLNKKDNFLLELKLFIESPFKTYFVYKELPLPYSFERFEELLNHIQRTPKIWKSFKVKLLNLYRKLT
jgi:hypothetical protein